MKAFDLIDSASFGYQAVWQERHYLLRLAFVPIMIKLVCTVMVLVLGYEENYLRQALISLPAAFAEGWLLAQFLRTLLLLERWPIMLTAEPSDRQMSALLLRARGIMSSTILYALITYLAYALNEILAMFYAAAEAEKESGAAPVGTDTNPLAMIPALIAIFAMIWGFRLLWLYIPVVVLMPMKEFLRKIGGFFASLQMLAVFLVTSVPCFILAILVSKLLSGLTGGPESDIGRFVLMIVSVLIKTLISLITTASMVYALREILPRHPKALISPDKDRS